VASVCDDAGCQVQEWNIRAMHCTCSAASACVWCPTTPSAAWKASAGFSHCWVVYVFHQNTGALLVRTMRACMYGRGVLEPPSQNNSAAWKCTFGKRLALEQYL
jgi:hypothetical protein